MYLSIQLLFVNPLLVPAMKFPSPLQTLGRGKRFDSFNRVVKDLFQSRVYKVALRLDFTCPNRDAKVARGRCIYCNNAGHRPKDYRPKTGVTVQMVEVRDAWQGKRFAARVVDTSMLAVFDHQQGAAL
jgi:radical SAM superfamily enzyme